MSHVTGHVTKRDTGRDMSRVTVHVSHATTTTPHPIISLVAVRSGLACGEDFIHRHGPYGASDRAKADGDFVAWYLGGVR